MNISHYLYPNDYNTLISIFSFNKYLLVKRHFWYISNIKGCVISIDNFHQKVLSIYIQYERLCPFNKHIFIYIYETWIFTKKILILEFSSLFILQMNTLQPYIIITTYPYIYPIAEPLEDQRRPWPPPPFPQKKF